MIWCRFEKDGEAQYGLLENDVVAVVDGTPFAANSPTGEKLPVGDVKLLPPSLPTTFFAVGLNYAAHIEHAAARGNPVAKVPESPEVGYRAQNALAGHDDDIVVPADMDGRFEAEPEIVAVIGSKIRHATREQAEEAILGWTIGNDVSARDWQRDDRTFWRAKNSDTFKPTGPWIVTDADPGSATTTTRVNGEVVSTFKTGDMIFDAIDYIVEITKYITMSPGDVLWMGADGTVPIAAGDTVEIDISGIGTLRNRVVPEQTNGKRKG